MYSNPPPHGINTLFLSQNVLGLFNASDSTVKFSMDIGCDSLGRNVEVGRCSPGIRLGKFGKTPIYFRYYIW
jgi:hypothetical protein